MGFTPRRLPAPSTSGPARGSNAAVVKIHSEATAQRLAAGELLRPHPMQKRTANAPGKQTETRLNFGRPIESGELTFLKEYAGRMADDADGKRKVKTLVGQIAPYTPYHFGIDIPLPQVLAVMVLTVPEPIEIRDGRYAMISGRLSPNQHSRNHRGRGFLWVDMREGFALGGIFFYPSNGEPTPTLTIFSRQLDRRSVKMSQLPRAFTEDLSHWAAMTGIPPITTRYFIGASGEKSVLTHDENYCLRSGDVATPSPKGVCKEMNEQASLIDMMATQFMEHTHNASNATMKMIVSTGQVE